MCGAEAWSERRSRQCSKFSPVYAVHTVQAAVSGVEVRQLYINGVEPGPQKRKGEVNFSKTLSPYIFSSSLPKS